MLVFTSSSRPQAHTLMQDSQKSQQKARVSKIAFNHAPTHARECKSNHQALACILVARNNIEQIVGARPEKWNSGISSFKMNRRLHVAIDDCNRWKRKSIFIWHCVDIWLKACVTMFSFLQQQNPPYLALLCEVSSHLRLTACVCGYPSNNYRDAINIIHAQMCRLSISITLRLTLVYVVEMDIASIRLDCRSTTRTTGKFTLFNV